MRRLKIHIVFLFTIFNFLFCCIGFSQVAIVVNDKVGVLIDSTENFKYLLFTDYSFDKFIAAQIFKNFDGSFNSLIYLKNNEVVKQNIDSDDIKKLSTKINSTTNNYSKPDSITQYSVIFIDGSVLSGTIKSFTNEQLELFSDNIGLVNVPTKNVITIEKKDILNEKKSVSIENPHYSRYFYAPSAIPLEKGEGYFQDIYVLFLSCNYSITDHTIIGGGFTIIPGLNIEDQLYFVNAKIGYQLSEKFYLGGGGLYVSLGEIGGYIGLCYAVGTYGTKNHNATFGLGYGISDNKLMETPVFTFSGMTRLSKRISLMTENWLSTITYNEYVPETDSHRTVSDFHILISYGFRFFSDNISFDIAFLNVPTSEELYFPGIPYIDFVFRF